MPIQSHPRDQAVQNMFDRIAGRYDLLNRVISFRFDSRWRAQAIHVLLSDGAKLILDLGTGTGDLALTAAAFGQGRTRIVGLDFSLEMLKLAQRKRQDAPRGEKTFFVDGSALAIPFKDTAFDGIMTAFVLRNVSDLAVFFKEAARVLTPGGKCVSLDIFHRPRAGFQRSIHSTSTRSCLGSAVFWPAIIARIDTCPTSVRQFHPPEKVSEIIRDAGFNRVTVRKFLCGAVCMHIAEKPNAS